MSDNQVNLSDLLNGIPVETRQPFLPLFQGIITNIQTQQQQINTQQQQINALKQENTTLKQQINTQQQQINVLNQGNTTQQQQINTQQQQINALNQENTTLKQRIRGIEDHINNSIMTCGQGGSCDGSILRTISINAKCSDCGTEKFRRIDGNGRKHEGVLESLN